MGLAAVSRNVLIRQARDLILTLNSPIPPSWGDLYRASSLGFSKQSWYSQDLTELLMLVMSCTLRFMEGHLNHTFDMT